MAVAIATLYFQRMQDFFSHWAIRYQAEPPRCGCDVPGYEA